MTNLLAESDDNFIMLQNYRSLVKAVKNWKKCRKKILTLNDNLSSEEFKIAWNALGNAEWILAGFVE